VALCPVVVGRDDELRLLQDALAGSAGGKGAVVFVTGEPGIGKSRLVRELAGHAARLGALAVIGRAVPAESGTPYRALTEALLQILRDRPLPGDAGLAPWLPALRAVLPGIGGEEDGDASSVARGEAVIRLIRRLGLPGGLLIALEDLHWADPDTLAVVEYLADNLAGERVLCVATSRSEPPSAASELARRLEGRRGAEHISLGRLRDDEVALMVRACAVDWDDELVARVQRAADGVPFLVEEVLASPGVPRTFAESVVERLADFPHGERRVLDAAAVLGRRFDWELLAAVTGETDDTVSDGLARGVQTLLLTADGDGFGFRHALTREAVLAEVLPPAQRALAASALAALDAGALTTAAARDLAPDLAERAGERRRAGLLLSESGNESFAHGALATAVDTLRRAASLLEGTERHDAERRLIEALALAGRVDEAMQVGSRLVTELGAEPATAASRADVHLRLAQAAVAASRWDVAAHHAAHVRALGDQAHPAALDARVSIVEGEIAFAADDVEGARRRAEQVLSARGVDPESRCQAFEIVGRAQRIADPESARVTFERGLATASDAALPIWRMRALHELGTIEMFDHAGVEKLLEARLAAEEVGAVSTVAVLDLQLAAAYTCRWELDESDSHSFSAITTATRLRLDPVRAKALAMLAGTACMRVDRRTTEERIEECRAAAPHDRMLEGFAWGYRGLIELLDGDPARAVEPWGRGSAILARLPHAEPAALRALWPAVLASLGDRRAAAAIEEARRLGVATFNLNSGLIGYAEAMLAGRAGDRRRADELVARADQGFVNCAVWADVVRVCAAPAAIEDGWGDPRGWSATGAERLSGSSLQRLADQCRELLAGAVSNPWVSAGVTTREAEVLRLVIEGRPNKEIAGELRLSARTVEKHVESLLRKTGARSRTELAVAATRAAPNT
jgi:DNA-binding CsgD family transcriptional regulator/KaiC/GvpD/RAD55 family RecA-like ATPase